MDSAEVSKAVGIDQVSKATVRVLGPLDHSTSWTPLRRNPDLWERSDLFDNVTPEKGPYIKGYREPLLPHETFGISAKASQTVDEETEVLKWGKIWPKRGSQNTLLSQKLRASTPRPPKTLTSQVSAGSS